LIWINRAYFYGYAKPSTEKLISEIKEKDTGIEKLRQQNEKLQQDVEKYAMDLVLFKVSTMN
jgi:hypothetical protein